MFVPVKGVSFFHTYGVCLEGIEFYIFIVSNFRLAELYYLNPAPSPPTTQQLFPSRSDSTMGFCVDFLLERSRLNSNFQNFCPIFVGFLFYLKQHKMLIFLF